MSGLGPSPFDPAPRRRGPASFLDELDQIATGMGGSGGAGGDAASGGGASAPTVIAAAGARGAATSPIEPESRAGSGRPPETEFERYKREAYTAAKQYRAPREVLEQFDRALGTDEEESYDEQMARITGSAALSQTHSPKVDVARSLRPGERSLEEAEAQLAEIAKRRGPGFLAPVPTEPSAQWARSKPQRDREAKIMSAARREAQQYGEAAARQLDEDIVRKYESQIGTEYLEEQFYPRGIVQRGAVRFNESLNPASDLKPIPDEYWAARKRLEQNAYADLGGLTAGRVGKELTHATAATLGGAFDAAMSPATEPMHELRERSPNDPLAKGIEAVLPIATPHIAAFTGASHAFRAAADEILSRTDLDERTKADASELVSFVGGALGAGAILSPKATAARVVEVARSAKGNLARAKQLLAEEFSGSGAAPGEGLAGRIAQLDGRDAIAAQLQKGADAARAEQARDVTRANEALNNREGVVQERRAAGYEAVEEARLNEAVADIRENAPFAQQRQPGAEVAEAGEALAEAARRRRQEQDGLIIEADEQGRPTRVAGRATDPKPYEPLSEALREYERQYGKDLRQPAWEAEEAAVPPPPRAEAPKPPAAPAPTPLAPVAAPEPVPAPAPRPEAPKALPAPEPSPLEVAKAEAAKAAKAAPATRFKKDPLLEKLRAAQKARDDARAAFVAANGQAPFEAQGVAGTRPLTIRVTPSMTEKGKWQTTYFDERGPTGHTVMDYDAALKEIQQDYKVDLATATVGRPKQATATAAPRATTPSPFDTAQAPSAPSRAASPLDPRDLKPVFDKDGNEYRYYVEDIPADKIVASNLPDGSPNPRYRQEFQARDFDIARARRYAEDFNPNKVLPEGSSLSSGSPVVWRDPETDLYHIIAGNHREVARQIAGKGGPVRVLEGTYEDAKRAAAASQGDDVHPETLSEKARAAVRAKGITLADVPDSIGVEPITRDNIDWFLSRNPTFNKKLFGPQGYGTTAAEKASAVEKVNAALVGLLPPETVRVVSVVGEGAEKAIMGAAPGLLRLQDLAKKGEILPEYDILARLNRAAAVFERFDGLPPKEVVKRMNDASEQLTLPGQRDPIHDIDQADAAMVLWLNKLQTLTDPASAASEAIHRITQEALDPANGPLREEPGMFGPVTTGRAKPPTTLDIAASLGGSRVAAAAQKFMPARRGEGGRTTPALPEAFAGATLGAGIGGAIGGGLPGAAVGAVAGALAPAAGRAVKHAFRPGSALHSAYKTVADAAGGKVRLALDKLAEDLTDNPKLDEYDLGEGVTVAHGFALTRQMRKGIADNAKAIVGNLARDIPEEHLRLYAEYPTLLRERDMATEGKSIQRKPDGTPRTVADVDAEIAALRGKVDTSKLDAFEENYQAAAGEMFDILKDIGMLPEEARKEHYARRLVTDYLEGKSLDLGGGEAAASRAPGSTKTTKGTERAIERDALRAMSVHVQETLNAKIAHDFKTEVNNKFALNDAAREGVLIPSEDHALYTWGEHGEAKVVTQPIKVKQMVEGALKNEKTSLRTGKTYRTVKTRDPLTGDTIFFTKEVMPEDPIYVNGVPYHLMPRRLAEGLATANAKFSHPNVIKGMNAVNSFVKQNYLNFPIPNVQYHVMQVMQDAAATYANTAPGMWKDVSANIAKYATEMIQDVLAENRGERAPRLEQRRMEGVVGGRFERFLEDALDNEGHIVNDKALPFKLRKQDNLAIIEHHATKGSRFSQALSEIREAAAKLALQDAVVEGTGASRRRGLVYAHTMLGNYWRVSPTGMYLAPFTQFAKWFVEAALRVTKRAAEDPRTGKASWRGFWWSPVPKAAIKAAVVATVNATIIANAKNSTDDEKKRLLASDNLFRNATEIGLRLPERRGGTFGQALLTPWKTSDGRRIAFDVDSYGDMMDAVIEPFIDAMKAGPGVALTEVANNVAGRMAPLVKLPIEMYTGRKVGTNVPIEDELAKNLGPEGQAEVNRQQGRLPVSNMANHIFEQTTGYLGRMVNRVILPRVKGVNEDENWVTQARMLGSPLDAVDVRDKAKEDKYKFGDAHFKRLSDIVQRLQRGRDGEPLSQQERDQAQAQMQKLFEFARTHDLAQEWSKRLKAGLNSMAKRQNIPPEVRREQRMQRFVTPSTPAAASPFGL